MQEGGGKEGERREGEWEEGGGKGGKERGSKPKNHIHVRLLHTTASHDTMGAVSQPLPSAGYIYILTAGTIQRKAHNNQHAHNPTEGPHPTHT